MRHTICVGDLYAFRTNHSQHLLLCTQIWNGPKTYGFSPVTPISEERPTLEAILDAEFYGDEGRVSDFFDVEAYIRREQPNIGIVWQKFPKQYFYQLRIFTIMIFRSDLPAVYDKLARVGNIKLKEDLVKIPSKMLNGGSIEAITKLLASLNSNMQTEGQKTYPIKMLID